MAVPPPAPRARPAAARCVRISSQSLPARSGRAHSSAGYAPHRAVPSPRPGRVLRQPGVYGFHRNPSRAPGASSPPPDMLLIEPFPPARRAHSYSVKSMDGRARCHTCRGAGAGREPGKIVRRGRTHWGPSGRTLPLHRSARPAHMEGACLSASFHPPAGTAVHGHPPAAPPHKTSPPRKKSGPAARQPPALHHPAPRRRQKVRPNAALPPSFGRCFCPSLSMARVSGGGRIARQAATIRAAAPLSVSPPAGPARGGRNRRRACHMAGRGSAPRRQDGVPSAQSRGGANARAARKLPKLGLAKARGAW